MKINVIENGKVIIRDMTPEEEALAKPTKEQQIAELKNWFDTKYRQFNEQLTRYQALGITETITDDFRGKTYSNLTELYNEAEVVRAEIHELEEYD